MQQASPANKKIRRKYYLYLRWISDRVAGEMVISSCDLCFDDAVAKINNSGFPRCNSRRNVSYCLEVKKS